MLRSSKAATTFFWTVSELSIGKSVLATKVLELGMTTAKASQNARARSRLTLEFGAMTDDQQAERGERRGEERGHRQEAQDFAGQGGRERLPGRGRGR